MRGAVVAVALALAGCVALPQDGPDGIRRVLDVGFDDAVEVYAACQNGCYEPTLAALPDGTLVAVEASGIGPLRVSIDGGHRWADLPPPVAVGADALRSEGDRMVQVDAAGRLWYSALAQRGGSPLEPTTNGGTNAVHVAASVDGGRTWAVNVVVPTVDGTDRQWLAVGARDEVYLAHQIGGEGEAQVRASLDGGQTFRPAVVLAEGAGIVGPPIVLDDGALLVPHFSYATGRGLVVSRSTDLGRTFTNATVGGSGEFFPVLAAEGQTVHAAWRGVDRTLQLSRSDDGGRNWTRPVGLSEPGEELLTGPWLAARNGTLHLAWFANLTGQAELRYGRLADDVFRVGYAAIVPSAFVETRPANTDLAHFAMRGDQALLAWAHGDGTARMVRAQG